METCFVDETGYDKRRPATVVRRYDEATRPGYIGARCVVAFTDDEEAPQRDCFAASVHSTRE